jgi:GTP cyclohydrolase IA
MGTSLTVLPQSAGMDLAVAERAAAAFLDALGATTPAATPGRMARAYAELLSPRSFDLTTFPNDEAYDELVLARDIPVRSVCEHHMLPFVGVAHVGYLPDERILGLSKLARVVELHAHRPQVQERLTTQVADWLHTHLRPRGVGVVVEAEHACMTLRGVRAAGTTTITSSVRGAVRDDPRSRAEFLALTTGGRHG